MMKTVSYRSNNYSVASSIWDLSLGDFLDLTALISKGEDPESLLYQIELLSLLSDIPIDVIEEMPFDAFVRLAEAATLEDLVLPEVVTADEIGLKESKDPITFQVEGETFLFQPDFVWNKMKDVARVEDLLKDKNLHDHLHYILALIAWKEGEVFDSKTIDRKAEKMCKAKMDEVYKPLFFFVLQELHCLKLIRFFSLEGKKKNLALQAS